MEMLRDLKRFFHQNNGKNKSCLLWLYSIGDGTADFMYNDEIHIEFHRIDRKNMEVMAAQVYVSLESLKISKNQIKGAEVALENYVLIHIHPFMKKLIESLDNTSKHVRERGIVEIQRYSEVFLKKNGLVYKEDVNEIALGLQLQLPLINMTFLCGKNAFRLVNDILKTVQHFINEFNQEECLQWIDLYKKQEEIRKFMKERDYVSFIANGSIIPRKNATSKSLEMAIPFYSPDSLCITITFSDGTKIEGMGIKRGIIVITGGGYSGKSTLLDGIEAGVYNHIPKDGREFVLTDSSAIKAYAEDSRVIENLDISPFFNEFPLGQNAKHFSTHHASGSVSQAANIVEAVCAKSKLILIDEDKSATNFMIRDEIMREIIKQEPIIPLTDRIDELFLENQMSTMLVIGGSSEYLYYANTIILLDNYQPYDITDMVKGKLKQNKKSRLDVTNWQNDRVMLPIKSEKEFLYFKTVKTENAKKIVFDEYVSDITMLTTLISDEQINTVAFIIEKIIEQKNVSQFSLIELIEKVSDEILKMSNNTNTSLIYSKSFRWFEQVRTIDIFGAINRMRGLNFSQEREEMES